MSQGNNRAVKIVKNILIFGGTVFVCLLAIAIVAPNFKGYFEHRRLSSGHENLKKIIVAQDKYYQQTGSYLPVPPADSNSINNSKFDWDDPDDDCSYGVTVKNMAYTAVVKCPLDNGDYSFLGYVKTEPGGHLGVLGPFGQCPPEGIHAGRRRLVNDLGPCNDRDGGLMSVVSGTKKRLVVKTLPKDATITANTKIIGISNSNHQTFNSDYGNFFWSDPLEGPVEIAVSKEGYKPISFMLDWDGFTYSSAITLRKK